MGWFVNDNKIKNFSKQQVKWMMDSTDNAKSLRFIIYNTGL